MATPEPPAVAGDWQDQAVVLADTSGVIRVWSPGAERLFGHRAADAVGQTLDLIVPERYRERHWSGFHAAMRAGRSRLDRAATVLPITRRDGSVVRCPGRFIFLLDARDRPVGAMAIFTSDAGPEGGGGLSSMPGDG
jgi:PAS domain S-box-containing protein